MNHLLVEDNDVVRVVDIVDVSEVIWVVVVGNCVVVVDARRDVVVAVSKEVVEPNGVVVVISTVAVDEVRGVVVVRGCDTVVELSVIVVPIGVDIEINVFGVVDVTCVVNRKIRRLMQESQRIEECQRVCSRYVYRIRSFKHPYTDKL